MAGPSIHYEPKEVRILILTLTLRIVLNFLRHDCCDTTNPKASLIRDQGRVSSPALLNHKYTRTGFHLWLG